MASPTSNRKNAVTPLTSASRATITSDPPAGTTSAGSVVAVPELLFQARQAQSVTYNATPIVMAAVIYFLILWPMVRLLGRLENRALAGRG